MSAEPEVKEVSADIKEMGDKIAGLTLLQAKALADYLKDAYGIEPASGGAVMMAAAPAGGAAEDEGPTEVSAILSSAGQQKIQVIKALREITGLGLKEAKALADGAPAPIKEKIPVDEAEKIKTQIEEVGGTVEIK
ncbi:MAG: 50S ribosomal protein L7/L12 [Planctomycetes bacterium]|nr:50S ribosomal protein L7/L12 [Planctomycetota bacterium]